MIFARLLIILLGLAAACLAAAGIITTAILFPDWSELALGAWEQGGLGLIVALSAAFVTALTLIPALAGIVLAEMLGVRSALAYASAGGLIGVLAYAGLTNGLSEGWAIEGFTRRELEVTAAAGIVGGVVYWVIAGRQAGLWRGAPARPRA